MFRILARTVNRSNVVSTRFISVGSDSAAYAGDGKTTVNVLNKGDFPLHLVSTYSAHGFRLHNNLFITGSIILFPTHVFSWNIRRGKDITLDSLLFFDLIVPKVKIVVIGYGSLDEEHDRTLSIKLKKKGISCELLATPNAVSTYNYLVADSVPVAGAFIPVREEVKMLQKDYDSLIKDTYNVAGEHFFPEKGEPNREDDFYESELAQKTIVKGKNEDNFDK